MKRVFTMLLLLIIAAGVLSSCASLPIKPDVPIALTPQQQLTQMVSGTNWVVTLMLFGVGAGFFAFLNGNSKGLQAMAACFVVLSLALGIARYSLVISAITMIGAVCLMVYTVLVKNKALKEVVTGVQKIREDFRNDSGGAVLPLAKNIIDGILDKMESTSTKQAVKEIKATL